jgi:hypothetical protein
MIIGVSTAVTQQPQSDLVASGWISSGTTFYATVKDFIALALPPLPSVRITLHGRCWR